MGDANLAKDEFFRDEIAKNKEGYVDIALILKCNKIKKLGVNKAKQVLTACGESALVEFSKDGLRIRRKGNNTLPEKTGTLKKRDAKV
jgi:hypothetical protein